MKKTVHIYCGEDGEAAKRIAAGLRTGETRVFLHAASGFTGTPDPRCDQAIVMPDVPAWKRELIEAAYGASDEILPPAIVQGQQSGFYAKHKGFGRWYLMRGGEVISGPHSKAEAERLAA